MAEEYIDIDFNVNPNPTIIKVIGVGGGGGNAVDHMYKEGIRDVSFLLCNTDSQTLNASEVPMRLQLGDGLGAGGNPEKARKAAMACIEDIEGMLNDGTRMVFITAGMGGGTGTGAGPIIAQCAKRMGILTVGIVTIPFYFEGNTRIDQALDGVEEMSKHVDALLVINNERLREIYPDLTFQNAFSKANDTLTIAARSIAEIITIRGIINRDFEDVKSVLMNGGVAIMSTGYAEGDGRVQKAIENALHSPLLNNNHVYGAKRVLLNILFSDATDGVQLTMEEMGEVHDFMSRFDRSLDCKFGVAVNPELGKKVKVTLLASGFCLNNVPGLQTRPLPKVEEDLPNKEEIEHEKEVRRKFFYPQNTGDTLNKRFYQIYRFSEDVLDNDDLITMVEESPTYKRTKEILGKIRRQAETARLSDKVVPTMPEVEEAVFGTEENPIVI